MNVYRLDLTRVGVEPWVAAVMAGRRPPRGLDPAELEQELGAALRHQRDDAWLARSPLWDAAPFAGEPPDAARLREIVANALAGATAAAGADDALALRAVALGYLTPGLSHEAAAERLAVSRATFYRLLHRGIRHLAEQLPRG